GFLRDYNSTHMYGKGVYFARDANYPVNYGYAKFDDVDKCAHLLYCRVICGEIALGQKDFLRPPSKPSGNKKIDIEYETMVNSISSPTIFVCCTDCQVTALIQCTLFSKEIKINIIVGCFVRKSLFLSKTTTATTRAGTKVISFMFTPKWTIIFIRKRRRGSQQKKLSLLIAFVSGIGIAATMFLKPNQSIWDRLSQCLFGFYTEEEIRKISGCEITEVKGLNMMLGIPEYNGLHDPRMGPMNNENERWEFFFLLSSLAITKKNRVSRERKIAFHMCLK
ncbi:hypothetical protein RFI_23505, partial [Reticulomyxa filosa]